MLYTFLFISVFLFIFIYASARCLRIAKHLEAR